MPNLAISVTAAIAILRCRGRAEVLVLGSGASCVVGRSDEESGRGALLSVTRH